MNIVILSGGSGNDVLMHGLIDNGYADDIKVITNAYDNGKSTGICRLVTSTLGVSDIRKNHFRMYNYSKSNKDSGIVEFYSKRYDLGDDPCKFCIEKLENWGLSFLTDFVEGFFERPLAKGINYKDFSIANIVYAEMYARKGYEKTNKYFCNLLGIKDFVLLNSPDNVFINAITENNQFIKGEERIVEYKNSKDPINKIQYSTNFLEESHGLYFKAIQAVSEADLIIISTGTFWSSIYPTLEYLDFYKYVNESNAKKIWVMNTEEDKDSYGVSSNKFIKFMENLGLDLTKFDIIENIDGIDSLKQQNNKYNIVYKSMGNHNGKNDLTKYFNAIKEYLNE